VSCNSDKEKGVMAKKNKDKAEKETIPPPSHTHGAEVGAIAGEIAGGIVGSLAGPPGAVAGMVMGAAAGALAGKVLDEEAERTHVHDSELDDEIGVTLGDLGAPTLKHPPAKTGAYSVASSGGSGAVARTPSSGPIPGDGED
jgi:phage tail tape-measure protein